jgi:hypothetical protein
MLHYIVSLYVFDIALEVFSCSWDRWRGKGTGRVRERRQGRGGRAEDKGAVDAISIPFYFDMRGRDSVLFRYAGRTVLQREAASGHILSAERPGARSVV